MQFNCVESLWRLVYFCDFSIFREKWSNKKKGMNQGTMGLFFFSGWEMMEVVFFSTFISNRKIQDVYSIHLELI